jgi:hypothetical protein
MHKAANGVGEHELRGGEGTLVVLTRVWVMRAE